MIEDTQAHNKNQNEELRQWRCPNCGQIYFAAHEEELPSTCRTCFKPIAWQAIGSIKLWTCPNCGQYLFTTPDEKPPEMCPYCQDFTTWKRIYG